MTGAGGERTEARLRRLEELVADLGRIADPVTREHARELLGTLIDLHALAIARLTARLARMPEGTEALVELGHDPQVRPVLLLHGLHPDDTGTRLREAIAVLREAGLAVSLADVSGRGAMIRLPDASDDEMRKRIEAALFEAAPELETIAFEEAPVAAVAMG